MSFADFRTTTFNPARTARLAEAKRHQEAVEATERESQAELALLKVLGRLYSHLYTRFIRLAAYVLI